MPVLSRYHVDMTTHEQFFGRPELMLACPVYDTSNGAVTRIGTATFVMPGIFLTAKHNFEAWQARGIGAGRDYDIEELPSGSGFSFSATVMQYAKFGRITWQVEQILMIPGYDIALLQCGAGNEAVLDLVNKRKFPGTSIGFDLHAPLIGEKVLALGFPGTDVNAISLQETPPENLVGSWGEVEELYDARPGLVRAAAIQVNNEVRPGMSGGPVLRDGQLICGLISTGIEPSDDYPLHTTFISPLWHAFSSPFTSTVFSHGSGKPRKLSLIEAAAEGYLVVEGTEHISSADGSLAWNEVVATCGSCSRRREV